MSLVLWLPLTDDYHNQGLNDYEISTLGTISWPSGGKLGATCLQAGNANQTSNGLRIEGTFADLLNGDHTVSVWVKPLGNHVHYNGSIFSSGNWNTPNKRWAFGVSQDNTKVDILCSNYNTYVNCAIPVNEWTHLVCTCGADRIVKLYKNGEFVVSVDRSTSNEFDSDNTFTCIGRESYANGYFSFNGCLQDFRLYDECLSPLEVKRISQGLMLHYPLNHDGWGQENLIANSLTTPVGSANAATGTWRLAGSSSMTRSRIAITDSPIGSNTYGLQSVGIQNNQDASCWGIDGFPKESGATYTISAWGRIVGGSSTAAMLGFSLYNATSVSYGGDDGGALSTDTEYYGTGAYDYAGGKLRADGRWTKVWRTFTSTATSGNIYIGFNTAKTGDNVTLQLCGVKLEKNTKYTPWTPALNDDIYSTMGLGELIEYDISGYHNDGTKIGSLTYSPDASRYTVSTHIVNGASTRISTPILSFPPDAITLNIWFKSMNTSPTGNYHMVIDSVEHRQWYEMCINYTGFLRAGLFINGTRYADNCVTKTALDGNWHMLTMTYDGTVIKRYFDGVMEKSSNVTATSGLSSPTAIMLGRDGPNASYACIDSDLSDFRIYTTALSADDIKALYEDSAYIASDGTSYAYEFVEE